MIETPGSASEDRDADERAEDRSAVDELAGISGGTTMAGGSGSPGDTRTSTGPVGTVGGASIGGMAAGDFVADESARPADADADTSPGTYEGAGATDLGAPPSNREAPGIPPILIAAEDKDEAAG